MGCGDTPNTLGLAGQRTLGEVDFLSTSGTDMFFIKFVGKNLFFLTAFWALAAE